MLKIINVLAHVSEDMHTHTKKGDRMFQGGEMSQGPNWHMCQKICIPTPRRVIGCSKGERCLNGKMKQIAEEFREGSQIKNPL